MATLFAASGAEEAIRAAGEAVNHLDVTTTPQIRRAVPMARAAALRVKAWSESRGHNSGDFTGLPIAIYQNWLFEQNRRWHFTDGTLCVLWQVEFPNARCDYPAHPEYIASTRRDYNNGRHQAPAPATPCLGYAVGANRAEHSTAIAVPKQGATDEVGRPQLVRRMASSQPKQPASRRQPLWTPLTFSSDLVATEGRIRMLDAYMTANVLDGERFSCSNFPDCRRSHEGKFFEGQLHHVGAHYDLAVNGRPLRVAVVGQEYGNGPAQVGRVHRSHDVVVKTGQRKRFASDGLHEVRNPHMKGTTSVLRLLFGGQPGSDYEGEFLTLDGASVHLFEAFALTNYLLCSAIADTEGGVGSKHGKSTPTMQDNCGRHFREAVRILEPNVLIVQGVGIRGWMQTIVRDAQTIAPNVERVRIGGHHCLLAAFTHPSVKRTEFVGGLIPREDGAHAPTQQVLPRIA